MVFGQTKAEHNQRLKAVLERIKQSGSTLNAVVDKCGLSIDKVKFLRHVLTILVYIQALTTFVLYNS